MEPEFGAGKFGIDRLVRIKARFTFSKFSLGFACDLF